MKKLVLVFLFIFLNGSEIDEYKNYQRVIQINKNFISLINSFEKNEKLKTTISFYSNSKYGLYSLLETYKKSKLQKYFRYLREKRDNIKLVLNIDLLSQSNDEVKNILVLKEINEEISKIKNNKITNKNEIKKFYKTIIDVLNAQIYLIEKYELSPNFLLVQKGDKKAYALKVLKEILEIVKKDYKKIST